jgi:hypothetical protein
MRHTTTHTQATWPSTHNHSRTSGCSTPQRTFLFINDTTGLLLLSHLQEGGPQAPSQTGKGQASAQRTSIGAYSPFIHSWAFSTHTLNTLRLLTILGRGNQRGATGVSGIVMHLYRRHRGRRKGGHNSFPREMFLECNVVVFCTPSGALAHCYY